MELKEIKFYHPNKQLSIQYFKDENGLTQGMFKRYNTEGKLTSLVTYKNGIPHGKDFYTSNLFNYTCLNLRKNSKLEGISVLTYI